MSAFIVSKTHVAALAIWAERYDIRYQLRRMGYQGFYGADAYFALLMEQNVRSVCDRYYGEKMEDHEDEMQPPDAYPQPGEFSVVALLKACDCLEYQSNETTGYYTSEHYRTLDTIRRRLISTLDGYDDANAWPIPNNEHQNAVVRLV